MRACGAALALWLVAAPAGAGCVDEIKAAAKRHGVPASVALSVAAVESSHQPLAMNIAGWPARAHSAEDGARALRRLTQAGIRSVDVGCMQINLKHHPHAFPHLEEAFDPRANADYGVRFLKRLHEQRGSWGKAIAAYHSGDPTLQHAYLERVRRRFVASE